MKNILFDANPIIHQKTGVGQFSERLLLSLADKGVKITAYYFNFLGRKRISPPLHQNITYKQIRFFPSQLLSLLNRQGIELPLEFFIETKGSSAVIFTNYIAMPTIRKLRTIPILYDMSFFDCPEFANAKNVRYLQKLLPRSIKRADDILTISQFSKDRILHYFPKIDSRRIHVLPIPYETPTLQGSTKPRKKISTILSQPYILHVGTLEPRKNLIALVKAFERVSPSYPTHRLVLAGGIGWQSDELITSIHRSPVRDKIILTGYINDLERDVLYTHADIVCSLSFYEGFGMPILEAQYYHCPLLISDIPVYREVAGDSVTYCDPYDIDDITEKLRSSLEKPRKSIDAHRTHGSWEENSRVVYKLI